MGGSIFGLPEFEVATECLQDKDYPWGIPIHTAAAEGIGMILSDYCGGGGAYYEGFYVDSFKLESCDMKGYSRLRATFHFRKDGQVRCINKPLVYRRVGNKMVESIQREFTNTYYYIDRNGKKIVFTLMTDVDHTKKEQEQRVFSELLNKFVKAGFTEDQFIEALIYVSKQPENFTGIMAIAPYLENLSIILRGMEITQSDHYRGLYNGFKKLLEQYPDKDVNGNKIPEITYYYYVLRKTHYLAY